MTDDDFKAAFRKLDRVEPSADFFAKARGIPLRYPREEAFSLWQLFKLPSRIVTLAFSATFGLAIGYVTLDEEPVDTELSAFLELDAEETLFATSADVDWDNL
jgi:hypothetical protein